MRNYSEAVNMSICDLTKYVIEQSTNTIPSNPENFEDMKNLMNLFPVMKSYLWEASVFWCCSCSCTLL